MPDNNNKNITKNVYPIITKRINAHLFRSQCIVNRSSTGAAERQQNRSMRGEEHVLPLRAALSPLLEPRRIRRCFFPRIFSFFYVQSAVLQSGLITSNIQRTVM